MLNVRILLSLKKWRIWSNFLYELVDIEGVTISIYIYQIPTWILVLIYTSLYIGTTKIIHIFTKKCVLRLQVLKNTTVIFITMNMSCVYVQHNMYKPIKCLSNIILSVENNHLCHCHVYDPILRLYYSLIV